MPTGSADSPGFMDWLGGLGHPGGLISQIGNIGSGGQQGGLINQIGNLFGGSTQTLDSPAAINSIGAAGGGAPTGGGYSVGHPGGLISQLGNLFGGQSALSSPAAVGSIGADNSLAGAFGPTTGGSADAVPGAGVLGAGTPTAPAAGAGQQQDLQQKLAALLKLTQPTAAPTTPMRLTPASLGGIMPAQMVLGLPPALQRQGGLNAAQQSLTGRSA